MKWVGQVLGKLLKAATSPGWPRTLLVALAVVGVAVLLAIANGMLGIEDFVAVRWNWARRFWLPLLFLMTCWNVWLGLVLWRLMHAHREDSDFEEIDLAWDECRLALRRGGIAIDKLPLFLILGGPEGGCQAFFEASGIDMPLLEWPRRVDAPVRITAGPDAIYVTCPGASSLGQHVPGQGDLNTTPTAGGAVANAPGSAGAPSIAGDPERPAHAEASLPLDFAASPTAGASDRISDEDPTLMRLRHLCRLIARDRAPFCPVNGVLVLIPWAATADDTRATRIASIIDQDLAMVADTLRMKFPVHVVACDLQTLSPMDHLIRGLTPAQRSLAFGRTLPLVPDLDATRRVQMVERGIGWFDRAIFHPLVHHHLSLAAPEAGGRGEAITHNERLVGLLATAHPRWRRLGRLIGQVAALNTGTRMMLGGCHAACTGRDPERQQAFVAGVLRILVERQEYVSWSGEALEEDRRTRRRATQINLATAAVFVAVVAAILLLAFL